MNHNHKCGATWLAHDRPIADAAHGDKAGSARLGPCARSDRLASPREMNLQDHVLCGTCVNERERHAGYFESDSRRKDTLSIKVVASSGPEDEPYTRYCCACGASTEPYAIAILATSQRYCDGVHELHEED